MRKILVSILRFLTRAVLARYQPIVIGVTGSVGKTSAKDAIYAVLRSRFLVAKSTSNINNEIGVPCSVLRLKPAGTRDHPATFASRIRFMAGILRSFWLAFGIKNKNYPRMLVLELGADKPHDIKYLAEMLQPKVAVITAVGSVPVHVEFYSGPEAVAREKAQILNHLGTRGVAILNGDDPIVRAMQENTKAKIVTYGLHPENTLWASDVSYYVVENRIEGLSCKIHHGPETFIPVRLPGFIGAHQVYSILAAVAVGLYFDMNLVEIIGAFETLELPEKRMRVLPGKDGVTIIDDTYNASPLSTRAAIATLQDFGKTLKRLNPGMNHRTIAVLGDMKELGEFSKKEHEKIGDLVASNIDLVITVGNDAREVAARAMPKLSEDRVYSFDSAHAAAKAVMEMIRPGDIVLVKGSRAMRLEIVVDALGQK